MLVGGIVAAVVVLGVVAAAVLRRRSHDDEHSVQLYHRSLHTLEGMRTHPPRGGSEQNGDGEAAFPASAFRVSGSSTVRLTETDRPVVPPVPPPPVAAQGEPMHFDDAEPESDDTGDREDPGEAGEPGPESAPSSFMSGSGDRAMHSINRRPRRLGAPAAAIGAVAVLIVVLILTGVHSNPPTHHGRSGTATTVTTATTSHARHPAGGGGHAVTTTPTTAAPVVSAPAAASAHAATYQVASPNFTLAVAATTADCWVQVTSTATGTVLFSGTLYPGQSHAIAATGPLSVVAGAPGAFSATVDGTTATLPQGYQAPFTLTFQSGTA